MLTHCGLYPPFYQNTFNFTKNDQADTIKTITMKSILKISLAVVLLFSLGLINNCTPTPPPATIGCVDSLGLAPLSVNLVAYYKFPSTGGPQLNDYSGNANHLTNILSALPDLNRIGSTNCAMRFNGSNYLETNLSTSLSYTSGQPFTLVLTFRPDATVPSPPNSTQILVSQFLPAQPIVPSVLLPANWTSAMPGLRLDSAKNIVSKTGTYLTSPGTSLITNNDWRTAIFVWDGISQIAITDHNFTSGITTSNTATVTPIAPCAAGSCPTHTVIGFGFKGVIDDIKLWSRVLTPTEFSTVKTYVSPCCQ